MLLFSAVGTTTVYADDGPTTATPEAGATVTSVDGQPPVTGTETPPPTETPVPDTTTVTSVERQLPVSGTETTAPTGAVGTDTTATTSVEVSLPAVTPEPVLERLPDNTTVTVLSSDGIAMSLASQDAANAIASGYDPIWCPAGQPPIPGANGCTQSFASFDALLTGLSGNAAYQGAGTIYVQQGAYAGGETSIDFNSSSYNLSNIKNFDLTVQGGWNTKNNSVDPASTTTFKVPIIIGTTANPWGGSLTFNNIYIDQAGGQASLILNSQIDITLTNVEVTRSVSGNGAELNAGRDVNIKDSDFYKNKEAGALIKAGRNVTIANSNFSNSSNRSLVFQQQGTGVQITSGGSVSLFNVYANANREVGANINAGGDVSIGSTFNCVHAVTRFNKLTNNCSSFSGNKFSITSPTGEVTFLGYGLQIVTPANINIDLVTANDNFLWGADLNAGGNVTISNSLFNGNTTDSKKFIDDTGLLIKSGGTVSLNNVQANDNRLIGAVIKATGDVNISNSTFSNNKGITIASGGAQTFYGYGLQVVSDGNIFLNVVNASNNNLFGAHLEAGKDVGITNSTFSNNDTGSVTDALGRGLEVISNGFAFLTNVTVDNNQLFGADVQANNDVFLDGVTATNNSLDGVTAKSNCMTVFLSNGTYANNGQYGLKIINSALDQSGGVPIFATNGAGDIFKDPGTCVFGSNLPVTSNTEPPIPATDPANNTDSPATITPKEHLQVVQVVSRNDRGLYVPASNHPYTGAHLKLTGDRNVTLNSMLTNNQSFSTSFQLASTVNVAFGAFSGKYVYVYSNCDKAIPLGYGVLVVFIDSAFADVDNTN